MYSVYFCGSLDKQEFTVPSEDKLTELITPEKVTGQRLKHIQQAYVFNDTDQNGEYPSFDSSQTTAGTAHRDGLSRDWNIGAFVYPFGVCPAACSSLY